MDDVVREMNARALGKGLELHGVNGGRFEINHPPGGSGWIISVGGYADNSFAVLGSSDPREVRLEL